MIQWIIFIPIVICLGYFAFFKKWETGNFISLGFEKPIFIILLITFILIWGGFFWW